jgi:hypothetical protein
MREMAGYKSIAERQSFQTLSLGCYTTFNVVRHGKLQIL